MSDIIVIAIVVLMVASALGYIIREKKSGAKCIGCPHGKSCGGKCSGNAQMNSEL